jgi:hypothetical protein
LNTETFSVEQWQGSFLNPFCHLVIRAIKGGFAICREERRKAANCATKRTFSAEHKAGMNSP